jgi:hypothetical protein
LPPELYAALVREWPAPEAIVRGRQDDEHVGNVLFQRSAVECLGKSDISSLWQEFLGLHLGLDWLNAINAVFWPQVGHTYKRMGAELSSGVRGAGTFDVMLDAQLCVNTPAKIESRVRGPHVDSPDQILGGLFYMPMPGEPADQGGELELYLQDGGSLRSYGKAEVPDTDVTAVITAPYAPNTLVLFPNGINAIHGVRARKAGSGWRRYVNLVVTAHKRVIDERSRALDLDQSGLRPAHQRAAA